MSISHIKSVAAPMARVLGRVLALVVGVAAAVVVQAVVSSLAYSNDDILYTVEEGEMKRVQASIRGCGGDARCFVKNMEKNALRAQKAYKKSLAHSSSVVRGSLGFNCQHVQKQIIERTLCYRDRLSEMEEDVIYARELNRTDAQMTAQKLMDQMTAENHFAGKTLFQACGAKPSDRCFKSVMLWLNRELTQAQTFMADAFDGMAVWSIFARACRESVGPTACGTKDKWVKKLVVDPASVPYGKPVVDKPEEGGKGAGKGAKSPSPGPSAAPSVVPSSVPSPSAPAPVPTMTAQPQEPKPAPSPEPSPVAPPTNPQPGGQNGGVPGGVVGGVVGATGPTGPVTQPAPLSPAELLGQVPVTDPNANQSQAIDCSPESLKRASQLANTRKIDARIMGQAILYGCRVKTRYSQNAGAVFLAEAALRMASLLRRPNLEIPGLVPDWFTWTESELKNLRGNPSAAGQSELQAFLSLIQETRAAGDELDVALNRNRSDSRFKQSFCPWLKAIETAEPGSTIGFPSSMIICPRG